MKIKTALAIKTPRIRVFSFPNSFLIESCVSSFLKVLAKAAMGIARKFANCISGITAPSSDGGTYFGTSQSPTKAFSTSAKRQAMKSISEYHQKSPIREWRAVNFPRRSADFFFINPKSHYYNKKHNARECRPQFHPFSENTPFTCRLGCDTMQSVTIGRKRWVLVANGSI